MARVAVVLTNYADYAERYLAECHRSLERQTYRDFTLFISDNRSTEATRRLIAGIAPEARLFPIAENRGWAGGNNEALRAALAERFELFVTLNIDTHVEPDWLEKLVEKADAEPAVQILQSKMLISGTRLINSLGGRIQYLGYGYSNGYKRPDGAGARYPVDFASGASMLVRREVFERVGLFREEYFMYCEDSEFCWRARLAGFRVGLAEKSVCHHKYSFRNVMNSLYFVERNRLLTLLTLEKLPTLLLLLPVLLPVQAGSMLYFTLRGRAGAMARLAAFFARPSAWRQIARRRREVAGLRRRRDAEVVRGFAGAVVFAEISNPLFGFLINPLLWLYWMAARTVIFW